MTGTMTEMLLAILAFVATHIAPSMPAVRARLVTAMGERGFQGVYSIVALATLVWASIAYLNAPDMQIWTPPTALRHLSLTVMPVALLLVIAALAPANPTLVGRDTAGTAAAGAVGMQKVTRHPMMWGLALWAVVHLLALGDVAALAYFGGLAVLALGGAAMIDHRKRHDLGEVWRAYERQTSFVPFAAVIAGRTRLTWREIGWKPLAAALVAYAVLLAAHPYLFGASPWPL